MKKLYAFLLALAALSACQEWDPVLTFKYPEPPAREPMMAPVNMTIAGLKQLKTIEEVSALRGLTKEEILG